MTFSSCFYWRHLMSLNYRSLNQVNLVGRLGQDASLKHAQSGTSFVTFSVATQTLLKKPDGTWDHPTTWHSCVMWGKRAETLASHLKKGTMVIVTGSIAYRDGTAKDGTKQRYVDINVDDVQLLADPSAAKTDRSAQAPQQSAPRASQTASTDLEDGDYDF